MQTATPVISASVGPHAPNKRGDVITVQTLLNENIEALRPIAELRVDGKPGPATFAAILAFQKNLMHRPNPDGVVDPHGPTLLALAKSRTGERAG